MKKFLGESVTKISKVPQRSYATLGYKQTTFMGHTQLSATLKNVEGLRTIITTAHEDDMEITHTNAQNPNQIHKAYVVNGIKYTPQGKEYTRVMIPETGGMGPKIVSTSNPEVHEMLRKTRATKLGDKRTKEDVVSSDEHVVGGVRIDSFGPYFGGSPTMFLTRTMKEQIYPDKTLFASKSIEDYRKTREEVEKDGPRISGAKEVLLVVDEAGHHRTASTEDSAFVNSTIHRGMKKTPDGEYSPSTCFTPGSALVSHSKSRTAERQDGSTLHTISMARNASADVLCHWLLLATNEVLGKGHKDVSGLMKFYSNKGIIESLITHEGLGHRIAHLGLLATATPFDMSTVTIHRDKSGTPLHVMIHKRTKPWPANESVIEITGAKGEQQLVIMDSIIPDTVFWRDFTVGKLTTPIMSESLVSGAIEEGQLKTITDPDLLQDMRNENEKGRFNYRELAGKDVPLSMLVSAAGLNATDTRSRVTEVSTTGKFDPEKMTRKHIEQDPGSMEFYFCGRVARVLAENITKFIEQDESRWENNLALKELWNFVTSEIPTYENMEQCYKKYATAIKAVTAPEDMERLDECLKWAKEAHEVASVQQTSQLKAGAQ